MAGLNEHHKRTILVSCIDIHRRLAELEAHLSQSDQLSPFSQYVNDLSPTEIRVIRDYFTRLRAAMVTALQEAQIPLDVRRTSLRWSIQCTLAFLNIAISEASPGRLRGYGHLDEGAVDVVRKSQRELNRIVERVASYVIQGIGQDLAGRLERLEAASPSAGSLKVMERVVTRWGLVEFRPQLDLLAQRLEAPQLEIAVFGRVSCGKSSLLNHVTGMNVLPVGVTPVTAVPTRLVRGERALAVISFAETSPRTVPVEELREYASEEGNPGNEKRVTGIQVQVPSPRLPEAVALVDTPGVGSLARSGSAETYAYLPRCDLGVVLIDSSSTLTTDDLDLLRLLHEAGTPAQVLLSKADLVKPAERPTAAAYVREQVKRQLGLDLPVHLVSTVGADEALLWSWFERAVAPLLAQQRVLAEKSLARKVVVLRESVVAVLRTIRDHRGNDAGGSAAGAEVRELRRQLDDADRAVKEAKARAWKWSEDEPAAWRDLLDDAARAVVNQERGGDMMERRAVLAAIRQVLVQRGHLAGELLTTLQKMLTQNLEALPRQAPLGQIDVASVRDFTVRGLPTPELQAWQNCVRVRRPWWAGISLRIAVAWVRRRLEQNLQGGCREQFTVYDRQIQAWVKSNLYQLLERYDAQADVFRQHVRRLSGEPDGNSSADRQALDADLRELQQTQQPLHDVASPRRQDAPEGA